MAGATINYRIKLLSGNNVAMLEASGYESEIFMPQVLNGRLTFLNIIPERRCCHLPARNYGGRSLKGNIKCETTTSGGGEIEIMPPPSKMSRMSAGGKNKENVAMPMRPMASSTPATMMQIKAHTSSNMTPSTFGSGESTLPTPEHFRKAVPAQRGQIIENTQFNLPKGIKVMRLYHNSRDGTPSKVGRLVSSSNMSSVTREDFHNLSQMSNLSCSFRIPSTPPKNGLRGRAVVSSTPLNKQMKLPANAPGSAKWRRCITPVRTYSKRGGGAAASKRNPSLSSLKKASRPVHIVPTYLVNPTQAPKPTHILEVRRRRLVVDGKVRISSRAFKRQQGQENNKKPSRKSILGPSVSFTALQKKRKMPMSAFDQLTNSNRFRSMSAKLNEQFRNGCVNKASSTNGKYRVLCSIPLLKEDEQVLELTQSEMPSFPSQSQMSNFPSQPQMPSFPSQSQMTSFAASAGQIIPRAKAAGTCNPQMMVNRTTSTMLSVPSNAVVPPVTLNPNQRNHRPNLPNNQHKSEVAQQQPARCCVLKKNLNR